MQQFYIKKYIKILKKKHYIYKNNKCRSLRVNIKIGITFWLHDAQTPGAFLNVDDQLTRIILEFASSLIMKEYIYEFVLNFVF